jgi:hypothetical protein
LLRHSVTNSTGDAALQLLGSTDRQVQSVAEQVLLLAPAELELRAWPKRDAALLLQHLAQQDELEASFDWACEHVELAALFRTLVQQRGAAFTVSATRRWLEQRPTLSSQWLAELCALGADADAELERLADAHSVELALRVRVLMALLQRKGTFDAEALCHRLLESEHAVLAEPAARWLWDDGTPLGRKLVLRKFIAGAFRQAFRLPLQHGDWPEFDALALSAEGDERSRAIALLQGSSESARIPRLLALWTTSDGQAREDARTALRTLSAALLLPYLRSALEAGDASVLEVVGPNPVIAAWLVELFRRSSQGPRWLAFFERTAGAGVLHAPGLCDALSECLNEPNLGASALRVLMRCDDWARPERCTALLTALAPVLAGPRRRELLPQLVTAIEPLSPQLQVQILVSIGSPTDECVSVALMDLVLTTASLKRTLPSALSAAVERQMRSELTGPPERARKILGHLAAAADTATARAELLDLLEQSLQHPSSRVRLHAHRLLRTHADRARYLEATRGLLDCADPMTLRGAIRALAFGGSIAAIPQLAELVFHGNLGVRKAASDGLIHLGHDAQPALTRALNHARPDRRSVLAALLEQISRATSNADDA